MRLNFRHDKPDERDEVLGCMLRKEVETAAGQCPAGFPGHSILEMATAGDAAVPASHTRQHGRMADRLPIAAAVIVLLGGSAFTAAGILGQKAIRSTSLEMARSIMPERSFWVQEAISDGTLPDSALSDFIEALWSSEATVDMPGRFF